MWRLRSDDLVANAACQLPLYRPAVKKDNKWNFVASQHKLMGPHNPSSNKSALVAITRGGTIRLLLQGQDMRWQDAKAELDSVSISSELLTHASMCADKGVEIFRCCMKILIGYQIVQCF